MKIKDLFSSKKGDPDSENSLSPFLSQMLKGVGKLGEKVATDIMIPRVDSITLQFDQPIAEVIEIMKNNGFSRFPVWKDKLDNIVGILYVKDLLYRFKQTNEDSTVIKDKVIKEEMLRKPFFVPESKKVESLLKEFQSKKVHIAVVLDEYGGFSGIVTLEDIIEIIIGDIQDEYDFEQDDIRKITDNMYEIDARIALDELEEKLNLDFSDYKNEVDTLGGLLYNEVERVPSIGEEVSIKNNIYQVAKKEGTKILVIKLKIPVVNKNVSSE